VPARKGRLGRHARLTRLRLKLCEWIIEEHVRQGQRRAMGGVYEDLRTKCEDASRTNGKARADGSIASHRCSYGEHPHRLQQGDLGLQMRQ
jgi:hypothetical protein